MIDLASELLPAACGLLSATCTMLAAAAALRGHWPPAVRRHVLVALGSDALDRLGDRTGRLLPPSALQQLERWLRIAGHPLGAARMLALSETCAVLSAAAGFALSAAVNLGPLAWISFPLAGGAAPLVWLHDRVRARRRAIVRALPYAVDLLTLSVEAGLDFTAALSKVVEKGCKGPLAHELSVAIKELRLGKTREEALRNLARRVDVAALTSFVQALAQADRMGTPLGKILRILSTQMRTERTQRAEKLANQAPVKLLLPLVLFIFPTLFLMLFGPIGYQVFLGGSF